MPTESHSRDEYTVGWVCALPKEQTAAVAMLDQRHSLPHDMQKSKQDSNTYTLGSIGSHNIVIACLPMGRLGTVSAATVVAHMVETFSAIRFGLMVGIGGGIPPNVRLGDVVVSVPADEYPGVVQWDFGKVEDSSQFRRIGSLNKPPTLLLTALSTLQTQHDLEGSNMGTYLQDWQKKYPKSAPKYTKTDALKDILFESGYSHVQHLPQKRKRLEEQSDSIEEDCLHCDKKQALERKLVETRVHYGLIASGNSVIKDAAFRDTLNKCFDGNVLCVEMEAAGLMDSFPCIVIRGICDYADSHKNKAWQEHAAAVGAAFAKELLGYVQSTEVVQQQPAKDILYHIAESIAKLRQDVTRFQSTQYRDEILHWLTSFDHGSQHSEIFRKRYPNTNKRFLKLHRFRQWKRSKEDTLYCPGIQGAGKTILASAIINDLESEFGDKFEVGVAYIYCDYVSPVTLAEYLSRFLKQLVAGQSPIPQAIGILYDKHKNRKTRATQEELYGALNFVLNDLSRAFIIVDALDERTTKDDCRQQLISTILSLQKACQINILATSRIVREIEDAFPRSSIIKVSADKYDVEEYLRGRIAEAQQRSRSELREEDIAKIAKATDGMFLIAELYINSLLQLPTRGDVEDALSNFTATSNRLDSAYRSTLERIQNQGKECSKLAYQALAWIVNAKRALSIKEICHALATRLGMATFSEKFAPSVKTLLSICAGLITATTDKYDKGEETVRLIHYTAHEYLTKVENEWYPSNHSDIAATCINYLSLEDFKDGSLLGPSFDKRLDSYPFYQYAAENWGYHVTSSSYYDWEHIVSFLRKGAHADAAGQILSAHYLHRSRGLVEPAQDLYCTGLHLAAIYGLEEAVIMLCRERREGRIVCDINLRMRNGRTALIWAAVNGHEAIVKQLISEGADVTIEDEYGIPPVFFAAREVHHSIFELLWALEKKKDIPQKRLERLIWIFNFHSHSRPSVWLQMMCFFHKVYSHPQLYSPPLLFREDGQAPLIRAICDASQVITNLNKYYSDEIFLIRELLRSEKGSADYGRYQGMSPLALAARRGLGDIVKLLVENGADLRLVDYWYGKKASDWARIYKHKAIESFLLEAERASVNEGVKLAPTIQAGMS